MVAPHSAQILITTARKRCRDGARICAGFHRPPSIYLIRQNTSRFRRFHFEGWNQQNKMKTRIDRKFLMTIMARDHETAELSRSRIVGMAFQLGAEPENLSALERTIHESVQRVEDTKPHRYAASQSARARHFSLDRARKSERLAIRRFKKLPRRLPRHRASFDFIRPADRDKIIKLQSDSEAIEAGAKIRRRGRNAYRDLLLFQRESAENARKRDMAALILTWPQSAARCSEA